MASFWNGLTCSGTCMARRQPIRSDVLKVVRTSVLVIDVQGARKVRNTGLPHVAIFVLPPSFRVLEQRLRGRSKDAEDAILNRLRIAREEVSAFEEYDYVVINDQFDVCVERMKGIVLAERSKLDCMRPKALEVLKSFQ